MEKVHRKESFNIESVLMWDCVSKRVFRPQRAVIFVHEKLQELFRCAEVSIRVEKLSYVSVNMNFPANITTLTFNKRNRKTQTPVRAPHTWRTGKPSDPWPRPSPAGSVYPDPASHIQNSKPLDHQRSEELKTKIHKQPETAGERETDPTRPSIKPTNTHITIILSS